jgi:signal peptidase II
MKRKDWVIILAPLFLVWLTDHISKLWGQSLVEPISLGSISFQLFHNHGAFLGFFSELPPLLRIVSLSTIGSFLVFSYAIIQYMLPIKSTRLRIGMSILLGGIIGNVYDRIIWGYVVDFIIIDLNFFRFHPMNLADIYQWIGYGFIATALLREEELLWPENNSRKRIWINPNFQFRYILFLLIIALSLTLISVVFSYTYLKVTIYELIGENRYIPSRFLIPYIFTYLAISSIFCIFLIIIGRRISHRNAGPVYAFDRYVNDLMDGRNRKFKLRSGDEFRQLEKLGLKLATFLKEHNLIDEEDNEKILTTQSPNATDLTIPAVPIDEQRPNYAVRLNAATDSSEEGVIPKLRDCPLCGTSPFQALPSPWASYLVECSHCHFVFDPSLNLNTREIYQDKYFIKDSGDQGFSDYGLDHDINLINFKKRLQKLQQLKPEIGSYLDIGCAYGDSLDAAAEFRIETIQGVELSKMACEKARAKGYSVFQGTLQEASLSIKTYDLITLSDVIEHVENPKTLIEDCRKHLNPEGLIALHTPNFNSWSARLLKSKWFHLKQFEHICFFTPETIQNMLEQIGFSMITCESSTSYLSVAAILRRLQIYKAGWLGKLLKLVPKTLAEKIILPLRTGNMFVIAKRQEPDSN